MNLKLEAEFSKAPILQEVDDLKRQIDAVRPLSTEIEGRVMQKLRLDWNYNSNAIEGNKLSYGETTALLMHGITAKGKPLKDHLDIQGHSKAVEYLDVMIKDERDFVEADIRGLHEVILGESYESSVQTADGQPTTKKIEVGKYKSTANHVQTITGSTHYYATVEETPAKMTDLMEWYVQCVKANIHPVIIAALFHHRFVAIHPFDDGNGRMARILMNLILMRSGYPPVVIKKDDRQNYYSLLSQADSGDDLPFFEYIAERLKTSLEIYIKAINGRDIDESEDIDKEIALLKMQLNGGIVLKDKKDKKSVERVFIESVIVLALKLEEKSKNFQEYFFSNQNWFRFYYTEANQSKSSLEWIAESYQEKYVKLTSDSSKELNKVIIEVGYKEYRNPENNFDLMIHISVLFETYYYKVLVDSELLISKPYHENLIGEDFDNIIMAFIKSFKNKFNENQKAPNHN